jgi:type II secretory ATPase GspE/PulE/Tfp pilus assembly ATPase PilB-like protein
MPLPEEVKHRLADVELKFFENGQCYRGAGCEKCNGMGMRGRLGFYEVILTNVRMRQAIAKRAGAVEMGATLPPGFITMRRDGMLKAGLGTTTVEEVLRATQDADESVGGAGD